MTLLDFKTAFETIHAFVYSCCCLMTYLCCVFMTFLSFLDEKKSSLWIWFLSEQSVMPNSFNFAVWFLVHNHTVPAVRMTSQCAFCNWREYSTLQKYSCPFAFCYLTTLNLNLFHLNISCDGSAYNNLSDLKRNEQNVNK